MKTAIIRREEGKLLLPDLLNKVLRETTPVCLGLACVATSQTSEAEYVHLEHIPDLKDLGDSLESIAKEIQDLDQACQDAETYFVFSDTAGQTTVEADNTISTDYMQPYSLGESDDGCMLAAILHGDFSAYAEKESKHPAEYFAIQKELLPRLQTFLGMVDGDIDKLMTTLAASPHFKNDILKLGKGDTVITLLASTGSHLTFASKPELLIPSASGWTTYAGTTASVATVNKLKNRLGLNFSKKTLAQEDKTTKIEPVVDMPGTRTDTAPITNPPNPPKIGEPNVTQEGQYFKRGDELWFKAKDGTKNEVKAQYLAAVGNVPENYRKLPTILVPKKEDVVKDLKDLGKALGKTDIKHTHEQRGPKSGPSQPLIPAELRQEILKDAVTMKLLDMSSRELPDLKEIEKKYTSFSEQFGGQLELKNFVGLTYDELLGLNAKYPAAMAVLTQNLIWAYGQAHPELFKAQTPEKIETTATPTVTKKAFVIGAKKKVA